MDMGFLGTPGQAGAAVVGTATSDSGAEAGREQVKPQMELEPYGLGLRVQGKLAQMGTNALYSGALLRGSCCNTGPYVHVSSLRTEMWPVIIDRSFDDPWPVSHAALCSKWSGNAG